MCFVSDRNEGLISDVKEEYPGAHHGYCVQHILGNITSKLGEKKKNIKFFNATARSATSRKYEYFMKLLDSENPRIRQYLAEIDFEKWARCKMTRRRYSIVTSNNAESLNNVDVTAREHPISILVEFMRLKLQTWFHDRRKEATGNAATLSPEAEAVL
ncbi:unnamed protein product [Cuscuta europaea]|uniref:MULE transposase domain-containing protein n=1 Tax=Cuscuta europaea TaxID=41803 RepID=A0A9P1DVL1_CUSEU|nr:unnamed protein product [Cuscuta europaea]